MFSQELSNFGFLQLLIGLPLGFLYYVALIRSVPKPKTGSTKPQVGHDTLLPQREETANLLLCP